MKIYNFEILDSTNNYLRENIEKYEEYDVISARIQSAGRGRQGNTWISREGMALFSFLYHAKKHIDIKEYGKLSLVCGLAVLKALDEIEKNDYKFKWTNDVYVDEKKISGILIERKGDVFIIGIGVNVNNEIEKSLEGIAIALRNTYDIEYVIKTIVTQFKKEVTIFEEGGFKNQLREINSLNYLKDREISVKYSDKILRGKALSISNDGSLEVEIDGIIKKFNVGEIIIKK